VLLRYAVLKLYMALSAVYLAAFCHAYCIQNDYDFGAYKKPNCQCVDLLDAEALLKPIKSRIRKSGNVLELDDDRQYQSYEADSSNFKKYLDY